MVAVDGSLLGEVCVSASGKALLPFDDLGDESGEEPLNPLGRVPADHGPGVRQRGQGCKCVVAAVQRVEMNVGGRYGDCHRSGQGTQGC